MSNKFPVGSCLYFAFKHFLQITSLRMALGISVNNLGECWEKF